MGAVGGAPRAPGGRRHTLAHTPPAPPPLRPAAGPLGLGHFSWRPSHGPGVQRTAGGTTFEGEWTEDGLHVTPHDIYCFLPHEVSVQTRLTRHLDCNIPLLSAAMDTVTEHQVAISMAQEGGLGVIHKNMSVEEQAAQVDRVKRSESGMISDPITVEPEQPLKDALQLMERYRISGVPVTRGTELVGILTNRDLRFETNLDQKVGSVMTNGRDRLVTVSPGIDLEEAKTLLHTHRIEKLLVVSEGYELLGLITIKDIEKSRKYPNANKDDRGRLRVGAAVSTSRDLMERTAALISKGVDLVVLDTAHGHSSKVLQSIRELRQTFLELEIVAGNIATASGCEVLIKAGVDAVKVGIGPGSICTTRVVTGVGVPQITAIANVVEAIGKKEIPIIADGGIRFSGDIAKAIAAGADTVMLGGILAGTEEAPGQVELYQGRSYKSYRGMGSVGAMSGESNSGDRYFQENISQTDKLVPEGIEGRVPYKGLVVNVINQLVGGVRQSMGYIGCKNIKDMQNNISRNPIDNHL